jgi:hypothetical protein
MSSYYSLDDFYQIFKTNSSYTLGLEVVNLIHTLDAQITPLFTEKTTDKTKQDPGRKKRSMGNGSNSHGVNRHRNPAVPDNWEVVRNSSFKPTPIVEPKEEGVEKWTQDIRTALNKLSGKNFDTQTEQIMDALQKCVQKEDQTEAEKQNNMKTIAMAIFQIASTNKFYAEIYASLYKTLIEKYKVFEDILLSHVSNFSNSVKDIQYVDQEEDYEKYCLYNKHNDARKATAVFVVWLMKNGTLPVLRVLKIMVAFQTLVLEYIDLENKTNEVEEMTEILFLLFQEGIDIYQQCKAEWIWKFVICSNIETLAKCSKKDKKSLSSRAIFKYMDMVKLLEKV